MKVFQSWSGEISCKIAKVLKEWIPCVIQSVEPYFSSEDIDKGARWSTDIAKELEVASYGILCITNENIEAPWLNFEAGALSKALEKSRVCPFLFNVKSTEIKGPLLQFQMATFTKDDILKLLLSINRACDVESLPEERLKNIFEVFWPKLYESIEAINKSLRKDSGNEEKEKSKNNNNIVIEEILELVRLQQKILRSPEELLPFGYLREIFREVIMRDGGLVGGIPYDHPIWRELEISYYEICEIIKRQTDNENIDPTIMKTIQKLEGIIKYLLSRSDTSMSRKLRRA